MLDRLEYFIGFGARNTLELDEVALYGLGYGTIPQPQYAAANTTVTLRVRGRWHQRRQHKLFLATSTYTRADTLVESKDSRCSVTIGTLAQKHKFVINLASTRLRFVGIMTAPAWSVVRHLTKAVK